MNTRISRVLNIPNNLFKVHTGTYLKCINAFLCVGDPVDFVYTGSSKITFVISRCDNFNGNKV
jgi:hypothetical protein